MGLSEQNTVRISVRDLVEWVLRSGNIDNRRRGPSVSDAMLIGAEAHRLLQEAGGAEYASEVPLKISVPVEDDDPYAPGPAAFLEIEGRADGIITGGTEYDPSFTIDEIKGVYRDIMEMEAPEPVHLAQAEMYAYMFALDRGLPEISVRMTYVQLEITMERKSVRIRDDAVRRFSYHYTFEEIETRFTALTDAYKKWVRFLVKHRAERTESVSEFPFPYEYRPGQKLIVREVYQAEENASKLFVQAPTGIGKTLAMLYPSVKAVGNGLLDRIFYLTAKTVTANACEDGMRLMEERGLAFSYTKITAKEKMCPLTKAQCDPEHCERAKGHFDRVNDALYGLITTERAISSEKVAECAEKHVLCPYELSLDASLFTDVVIGDYNYAFDPRAYLRRYFADGAQKDYVLLIDEAHNLVDRARDCFSSEIGKEDLLLAKKLFRGDQALTRRLNKANRTMLAMRREMEERGEKIHVYENETLPEKLYDDLYKVREALSRYFDVHQETEDSEEKRDFFFKVAAFTDTWEAMGEGYRIYAELREDASGKSVSSGKEPGFFVKLFCIHPAERLRERLSQVRSAIFFSATFLPVNYYKELLCGSLEERAIYVDSPLDADKRRLFIARDVSTKYTRRNEEEYRKIADYLVKMVSQTTGNYMAFFPSHHFLSEVLTVLGPEAERRGFDLISQKRVMREEERKAFLEAFQTPGKRSLLGLSVMGGVFSEGIDLTGEKLIGVAVVGTGLPQITREGEMIKDYFDARELQGFDYAYRFPGFNKVMQAAGRLIRTASDYGVILLLDERFLYAQNRQLFPKEWRDARVITLAEAGEAVRDFWRYV
ncbi:MAG: ATP-dependent DNA helicase [Lachnospiraceae bacterium]|nr:ATP-dependent DNA helicase [Lachnospiraceae bacterium]